MYDIIILILSSIGISIPEYWMLSGGLFDQRVSYSLCPSALGKVDLHARRGWNQNFPLT